MLVDTGAALSTLKLTEFPDLPRSGRHVTCVGVEGISSRLSLSVPTRVNLGPMTIPQAFLLSASTPENLLGMDFLGKVGAVIFCKDGQRALHIPDQLQELHIQMPTHLARLTAYLNLCPLLLAQVLTEEELTELEAVPACLWAVQSTEAGLILSAQPLRVQVRPGAVLPRLPQYPLKPEAERGLAPVIEALVRQGIIVAAHSPANTAIMALKKPNSDAYRLVQDLRPINDIVEPMAAVTPNPATIMSSIPIDATCFTVVDLCSAFFSVPLHEESWPLFAFCYRGIQFCWRRMPMGFVHAPTIFSQLLHKDLEEIALPGGSELLMYVDDLLICSKSRELCVRDTVCLLSALALKGHKASKAKLQYCQPAVKYLGHIISAGCRSLDPERVKAIAALPLPATQSDLRSFLGVVGYCRQWVCDYALVVKPLQQAIGTALPPRIDWTAERTAAFEEVKKALCSAPALGLPDYSKEFVLHCHERKGVATGVLLQDHCSKLRPLAYFSTQLDAVAAALPSCLRAVAASVLMVQRSKNIVLDSPLRVKVPHSVHALLNHSRTQHMSSERKLRYEEVLFNDGNITVERASDLNLASLVPGCDEYLDEHDCLQVTSTQVMVRPDLSEHLIPEAVTLFVDGSAQRRVSDGALVAGYAVIRWDMSANVGSVVEAVALVPPCSAQVAELIALTRACTLMDGQDVNILADSKYALGVCMDFGALWRERGFLTSTGTPIKNAKYVAALLDALLLPRKISMAHCRGHQKGDSWQVMGNNFADQTARAAAAGTPLDIPSLPHPAPPQQVLALQPVTVIGEEVPEALKRLQATMEEGEAERWAKKGCALNPEGVWLGPDGKPVAPAFAQEYLLRITHNGAHVGADAMTNYIKGTWHAPGLKDRAARFVQQCLICQMHNGGKGVKVSSGAAHVPPPAPFFEIQMDFVHMPPVAKYRYILVMVDVYSGYIEAFPTVHPDAITVAKRLLRDICPRWGVPAVISSDRGVHFNNEVVKTLCGALGIDQKLHVPYRPQSSGKTERRNGELKNKLSKICDHTGLSWPDALPLALMYMRGMPSRTAGLSPFEIITARAMPLPAAAPPTSNRLPLALADDTVLTYVQELSRMVRALQGRVEAAQPVPGQKKLHTLVEGDQVMVKNFVRDSCLQPRWKGPHTVLLTTDTAVKVDGVKSWLHATHTKKVPRAPVVPVNIKDLPSQLLGPSAPPHSALKGQGLDPHEARYNLRPRQ